MKKVRPESDIGICKFDNDGNWSITLIEGSTDLSKLTTAVGYTIDAYRESEGTIKIFAMNMRLYPTEELEIKYVYCPNVAKLLELCNLGIVKNAIVILNEADISSEDREQDALMALWTWFYQQIGKQHIHIYIIVQNGRFIDCRIQQMAQRRILCRADDRIPGKIWLTIRCLQGAKRGKQKTFSYHGSQYFGYLGPKMSLG